MTKQKYITKILIDSREQKMANKSLIFFKNKQIPTEIHTLPDGDLLFLLKNKEKVYIERKSFSDYVSSYIKNNHIQDQAIRLSKYHYYACIVHGSIQDLKRIPTLQKISQNAIDKMTVNLMLFYHLPIFFVNNETEYLKLAFSIANVVGKHHGKQLASINLNNNNRNRPDIGILTAQNNIGIQKAKMLLDEFGSPSAVLNANREDLLKIKGVGEAMIANIKELKKIYEEGLNEQKKISSEKKSSTR